MGQIQHLFFQITQRVSLRYCQWLFLLVDQVSGPKDRLFKRYIQEYLPRVPCSFNTHGGNHSFIFSFLNSHWSLHFCHVVLFLRFFVNKRQNKYFNTTSKFITEQTYMLRKVKAIQFLYYPLLETSTNHDFTTLEVDEMVWKNENLNVSRTAQNTNFSELIFFQRR